MEPGGYKGLQSWGFKARYSDCLPFPRPLTPHPPHEIPELRGALVMFLCLPACSLGSSRCSGNHSQMKE